jgi:opine dehydrogenase
MSRVAVLGGGAGGHAVAAECACAGHEVTLMEAPEFASTIADVKQTRVVQVLGRGPDPIAATLAGVTTDAAEAVPGADIVFIVTPCFGHEPMAQACAPHLRDGQSVVFFGEGSGSLVLRKVLRDRGLKADVLIGETNTLPYLARMRGPARVYAIWKKGGTLLAAYPGRRTTELLARLQPIWPYLSGATNVLETILVNFNAIDHVATMICNAGFLETRTTPCLLWGEGASPGVARAIEAVDEEILAIRAALGLADRTPYRDFLFHQGFLDARQPTTHEAIRKSTLAASVFQCGPQALQSRFLTEDVPYAHVLISEIGDVAGVDTPVIDGLIALASAMNADDYRKRGRTLASLGLGGVSRDALVRLVNEGDTR